MELVVPSGDLLALLSEARANAAAPKRRVPPAAPDMARDPVSRAPGPGPGRPLARWATRRPASRTYCGPRKRGGLVDGVDRSPCYSRGRSVSRLTCWSPPWSVNLPTLLTPVQSGRPPPTTPPQNRMLIGPVLARYIPTRQEKTKRGRN